MGKKDLNILSATKMLIKLDLYVYFSQKWVEETLMKLDIYLFNKRWWVIRKIQWNLELKNSLKKEFDSEPVYKEKYLKSKIKSFNGKINTNFYNNEITKGGSQWFRSILFLELVKMIFLKCF